MRFAPLSREGEELLLVAAGVPREPLACNLGELRFNTRGDEPLVSRQHGFGLLGRWHSFARFSASVDRILGDGEAAAGTCVGPLEPGPDAIEVVLVRARQRRNIFAELEVVVAHRADLILHGSVGSVFVRGRLERLNGGGRTGVLGAV
eukprot:SAG11_NODE_6439_length_1313_cov_2.369028_2_plen_148_part_00